MVLLVDFFLSDVFCKIISNKKNLETKEQIIIKKSNKKKG